MRGGWSATVAGWKKVEEGFTGEENFCRFSFDFSKRKCGNGGGGGGIDLIGRCANRPGMFGGLSSAIMRSSKTP